MSAAPFRTLPRSDGGATAGSSASGFASKAKRTLDKVFTSPVRLMDRVSGVRRFGVSTLSGFFSDPFHTLLNMPWPAFVFVFFGTYLLQYIAFALIYWAQGSCVIVQGISSDGEPLPNENTFTRSLWMSSRVSSTLGFTDVRPAANCGFTNFSVMIQVIFSSLISFILLGVVFARFSAPFKRASAVRFSKVATVSRHASGFWAITVRVANLRKHQILQPNIRMVVTAADSITPSYFQYEQLAIEGQYKQLTNLELGFPAHVVHVITPESFLFNLSLLEMDTRMMEILVFVDGIDAMTSRYLSARVAFSTSDMYMNEQFAPMHLEMRGKRLGLDFNSFDKTVPALDPALLLDLHEADTANPNPNAGPLGAGQGAGLWQLRHQTFRRLAERYAHLGAIATTPGAYPHGENGGPGLHPRFSAGEADGGNLRSVGSGSEMGAGLLGSAVPSHLHVSASSMAASTSGMPFAVTKAGAKKEPTGLASIFGLKPKTADEPTTGGAWLSQHSAAHAAEQGAPSGSDNSKFVSIPAVQRSFSQGTGTGTAWQQASGGAVPLAPMPGLGAPPLGLGGQQDSHIDDSQYAGAGPGRPLLYTLDEEAAGAPAHVGVSLPPSQHASK